jgi:hypothetical protein
VGMEVVTTSHCHHIQAVLNEVVLYVGQLRRYIGSRDRVDG